MPGLEAHQHKYQIGTLQGPTDLITALQGCFLQAAAQETCQALKHKLVTSVLPVTYMPAAPPANFAHGDERRSSYMAWLWGTQQLGRLVELQWPCSCYHSISFSLLDA